MAEFIYQARDVTGQRVDGRREAGSSASLATQLISEGLTPIHIEQGLGKKVTLIDFSRMHLGAHQVSLDEILIFCRQMHTLIKAGIPIVSAMTQLADITRNVTFASALRSVAENIAAGQKLGTSCAQFPHIFSNMVTRLIEVGEETGHLDQAFLQIADYIALESTTVKRVKAVFRYPLIVFSAIVAAIIVINIFVIPNFSKLFASFHTQLPLPTRILLGFSEFMLAYWMYLLALFLLAALAFYRYIKTKVGRFLWDRSKLRIPIFGSIIKRIILARFSRTFAILIRSGLPLIQSIDLVAAAMDNAYAQERILFMSDMIERGESLTRAATGTNLFSSLVLQMISVGEETGNLDQMLQEAAEFYEREVDYDLKRLADLIEPILLVGVAAMVLMLALGVFLPMWDITKFARGGG